MFPGKRRRDARWGTSAREPLRRAFEAAGCYEPGRLIHAIRHSFATSCDDAGVGIETIRVMLGHSSVAVTAGYLHTDRKRLADAAERGSLFRSSKR
jgi:integrase/recombinase XerD